MEEREGSKRERGREGEEEEKEEVRGKACSPE